MSQFYVGVTAGSLPPTVPTSFLLDDTNTAIPLANQIIVSGGGGATTSLGASNEIIITVNTDFTWSEQAAPFLAAIQNGYFLNNALTATLPPSAGLVIGNSIIFYVDTASSITIQAGAGEFIQVGSNISVAGGIAVSNTQGSILELVYKPSDLTWHTISSLGSWSVT